MIDLDEIENLVSNFRASVGGSVAIELITRLRRAEKDAARYRFMRDMSDKVDVSRFFYVEPSERDAEIDEVMQCK